MSWGKRVGERTATLPGSKISSAERARHCTAPWTRYGSSPAEADSRSVTRLGHAVGKSNAAMAAMTMDCAPDAAELTRAAGWRGGIVT